MGYLKRKMEQKNKLSFEERYTLVERYSSNLRDYSHFKIENPDRLKSLDTSLRILIGKTDDIRIALCSHQAIINREFPEHFCRICNTDLSVGNKARWNDFLVLRHPQCQKPICGDCAKNNPDEFHIAFKKGLDKYQEISEEENLLGHFINALYQLKKEVRNSSQA